MLDIETIFQEIKSKIDFNKIQIIGIDGLGGAGKSTISESLVDKFEADNHNCILLHIDDFINVQDVRYNPAYPEWQCYYDLQWRFDYFGGVIQEIKNGEQEYVDIELYDKENDTYIQNRFPINTNTVVIVEGIFLQKKEWKNIFDYMIYIDISEEVRLQRVLKRDTYIGDELKIIEKYKNRYFPAEHRYVEEYRPQENADFVILKWVQGNKR